MTVAGDEAEGSPTLLEGPGVGIPPAALWPIVRRRLLTLECEAVLWEVALALLGVPPWRWRDYRVVLRNMPVPGSACTRKDFGTVMREWWMVRPESPVWVLWPPTMLFALVGLIEATEGARWAVAILRGFCWRQMASGAPPGRQKGRPLCDTSHRATEFAVAWVRAFHRDRQGRLDGRVCWDLVNQYRGELGFPDVGDNGCTPPEEKLRTNFARRQRTLRRRRVPRPKPHQATFSPRTIFVTLTGPIVSA